MTGQGNRNKKQKNVKANFASFQKSWEKYKQLMQKFNEDQALQRTSSLEPEFEDFFDVNEVDDVDDDKPRGNRGGNPFE